MPCPSALCIGPLEKSFKIPWRISGAYRGKQSSGVRDRSRINCTSMGGQYILMLMGVAISTDVCLAGICKIIPPLTPTVPGSLVRLQSTCMWRAV